ncbi:MAG: hypothetical protein H2174_05515 [Vampirovibrio sp.]|nr:hypothetical protein [Vampirovibrio sp.]
MMMMTSLMSYPSNPFAFNTPSASGYNKNSGYLPQFQPPSAPSNYFPVFGKTADFGGFGSSALNQYPYPSSHNFVCPPQGGGLTSIIQLVLSKLFHPAQEEQEEAQIHTQKHPKVRVHNDTDYTEPKPKAIRHKKRIVATNPTKKADLPEGVTPLSYKAIMNNADYKEKAIAAVKEWQGYLTTYGKRLDTKVWREKWADGAVNYLALLNDPKVRDLFMDEEPKLIGAYYNQVLRTLREDDGVRAAMKKTEQNAKILAIVDKTNKAIFEHRIFKTEAS